MPNDITPKQLAELQAVNKSVELIDVRTPVEFREVHVDFARNLPLDQLDAQAIRAHRAVGTSLLVITLVGMAGVASHLLSGRTISISTMLLFVVGGIVGMFLGLLSSRSLSGPTQHSYPSACDVGRPGFHRRWIDHRSPLHRSKIAQTGCLSIVYFSTA